ncbi:undecaprenyldiphospho-muramoylpentapeptide beta-N-acetylglucosaminyltransferase [Marinomonas agarivorans]|nr:undecaprenyldiphospho-muramoylpentapeptide beta-N-acetylglucosaminyltransferase [Marinomonas agarivorans]
MSRAKRIVIMAGGTGGHIYPALACAEEFKKQHYEILWLGSKKSMEETLVPSYQLPLETISIQGVRGKGIKGLLLAPLRILHAVWQAVGILRRFNPDVVLGMGGFVTGPGGIAAKLLGIPLVIHEQNAIAGTTNKLLAKVANTSLQAFNNVLPAGKTVGNPVRASILQYQKQLSKRQHGEPLKLLIVGGSLGAQYINQLIPVFLDNWNEETVLDVWHQTGKKNIDEVLTAYKELNVTARVDAYIDDMNQAYEWADLVICRAGAMTVSELAIVGLPSILVPFPYAIDDHQTHNAMHLVNVGAAKIQQQTELTEASLAKIITHLLENDKTLMKMGAAAKEVAYPLATNTVVDECERLINNERDESAI